MLRCNRALLLAQPNLWKASLLQMAPPTLCSLIQSERQHPCCCLWLYSSTEFAPRLPIYIPVFQKSRWRDSKRLRVGTVQESLMRKRIREIKSLIGKRISDSLARLFAWLRGDLVAKSPYRQGHFFDPEIAPHHTHLCRCVTVPLKFNSLRSIFWLLVCIYSVYKRITIVLQAYYGLSLVRCIYSIF